MPLAIRRGMDNENTRSVVLEGPGVPIEPEARDQLESVARRLDCACAVGMPDLHAGPGQPIGAAFAMHSLWPRLVGGDAGCGVRITVVARKTKGDRLLRRVDGLFDETPDYAPEVHRAAWEAGVRGLGGCDALPERLRVLAAQEPEDGLGTSGPPPLLGGLDSVGGGNHFAEIARLHEAIDGEEARALGLDGRAAVVVVHSGSRGVGKALGQRYGMEVLDGAQPDLTKESAAYLGQLTGAVRYAAANRFLLSWRLMVALGNTRSPRSTFDVVHNTVVPATVSGQQVWLHRKGCAPAAKGQRTVVLGSRGTPSWILRGAGNDDLLSSVAHGAGRRLTRSDARARFRAMYKRSDLTKTAFGGVVRCDRKELLYEEHPEAYKPIGPVVDVLEKHGLATRVASLVPQITVKR